MFTFHGRSHAFCDRTSRREFLRAGGLGLAGLTIADLLRNEARGSTAPRPKSMIYVVLGGGVSHLDSYDLKPDAPAEIRGPMKSTATALPGVRIVEQMPRQAAMMDQFALLRGVRSVENDHFLSEVYSGMPRGAGKRPAFGSVASRLLGNHAAMPTYVSLSRATTDQFEFEKPHYAGSGHAPFRPFGEAIENLAPAKSLTQLHDRKSLLKSFDTLRRDLDKTDAMAGMDRFQVQALDIMTSPKVREAFDLKKEPPKVVDRYGKGKFSHQAEFSIKYDWDVKPFILARRLVEAGVRVVTLSVGSWDHHSGGNANIFEAYKLVFPVLDASIAALVTDLKERGLDEDVLVVVLGEFGRSPKIGYPGPGREHWADAGCVLLAGGGLKMGQVIGETDSRAEQSKSGTITFQNIMATIYHVLGVDLNATLTDFDGRPQTLLDDRQPIAELVG